MRKRLIGILFSLALVTGMIPALGMVQTAYADDVQKYDIWVGSEQVTSTNKGDVLGDGTVSYDPDTYTLTLNNATIKEVTADDESILSRYNELNIVLKGDNKVEPPASTYSAGILVADSLNISGEGSLRVSVQGAGIYASKVTIDGGNLEFAANGEYSYGIFSAGKADSCLTVNSGYVKTAGDVSGIVAKRVEIKGGTVIAQSTNHEAGIMTANDDVMISGGSVTASAAGGRGIEAFDGNVTISGGSVTASGKGGICGKEITIGKDVSGVVSAGTEYAFAYFDRKQSEYSPTTVRNAIAGTGWTNTDGTEGAAVIAISSEKGQDLSSYKKVQFPKPAAEVTTKPAARSLTADGSEQELVTAGKAENGTMQYAFGTDDKTAPETNWSPDIPKGTDAGDYYVWYKAVGNDTHSDSEPVCVKVTIAKKPDPTKAKPVAAVKGIAKGKTALKFTWNKVDGAASYEIWMAKCNTAKKKYSVKRVKKLGADKTTYTKKKLKKNTAYRFYVVAKDSSGNVISKSLIGHAYTGNVKGKYTNAKSLKVSQSSFTLSKGDTAKIKATQTKARPGKKLCSHAKKLRYKSNNTSVAKVDSSGKITAAGTGTCKIYVQTVNGIWKTVKVTVN